MSDDDRLDRAINALIVFGEHIFRSDALYYKDIINWLEELKERRKESNTEYDMNLVRRQWEEE